MPPEMLIPDTELVATYRAVDLQLQCAGTAVVGVPLDRADNEVDATHACRDGDVASYEPDWKPSVSNASASKARVVSLDALSGMV